MTKKEHPVFHRALMEQGAYPAAKRKVKFQETHFSYIYKTGDFIHRIRKESPIYASLALKERYTLEAEKLGARWAPGLEHKVFRMVQNEGGYVLTEKGEAVDFALRITQVSDHYWVARLLEANKFSPTMIGRLARFLAEHHRAFPLENPTEQGKPEHLSSLAEEVLYQSKKYLGITTSEPLLEMVTRPLIRFFEDNRKLFLRRLKKNRLVECHGQFNLNHIFIKGREIEAISPMVGQNKYTHLDAANDLATLLNELNLKGQTEMGELLVKRYITAAKDRDILKILPVYQVIQAIRKGVCLSEKLTQLGEENTEREATVAEAEGYFTLALKAAKEIPKA